MQNSSYTVNLHPPIRLVRPILTVGLDGVVPDDLRPHSQLMRARWNKPAMPTTVFVPTKTAANLLGATTRGLPPLAHRDHDALLTDALIHHLRADPTTMDQWLGEQMLDKAGHKIKDPDAFKVRADRTPYQVIESGGAYSANQLRGLVRYALERDLELEVW